jgi:hypothetical protein
MTDRRRSRIVYLLAILILLSAVAVDQLFSDFDDTNKMVRVSPRSKSERPPDPSSVAYVLGGTQESLSYKWKTVGRLYAEGAVGKILILHRRGITEYSPAFGRNLTNDEWAVGKLKEEGVAAESVEFVSVPPAAFGTFAEARVISALARSRRVKRLVLVSSMHHTRRVWLSFSHFNTDNVFEAYLVGSEERASTFELLLENMKLGFYRYFVFPIDRLRGHFRRWPRSSSPKGDDGLHEWSKQVILEGQHEIRRRGDIKTWFVKGLPIPHDNYIETWNDQHDLMRHAHCIECIPWQCRRYRIAVFVDVAPPTEQAISGKSRNRTGRCRMDDGRAQQLISVPIALPEQQPPHPRGGIRAIVRPAPTGDERETVDRERHVVAAVPVAVRNTDRVHDPESDQGA